MPAIVEMDAPLGRIGSTEDIAEVVAPLVSNRAKYITGANYGIDGGVTPRLTTYVLECRAYEGDSMRYEEIVT